MNQKNQKTKQFTKYNKIQREITVYLNKKHEKYAEEVITYVNDSPVENLKYVDGPDFVVEISNVSSIAQLTVNCKGQDIEIDAIRLINDDIEEIISDLQIETEMKEQIDEVIFSELPFKLRNKGLKPKFVRLFLKLLEYIDQV